MLPRCYEWTARVRHGECGRDGDAKWRSYLDYLQEAAAIHAEQLGFGISMLATERKGWVLSKLHIRWLDALHLGEEFCVRTWPMGVEKIFAKRQYEVQGKSGCVMQASSFWILLHADTLRPIRPDTLQFPDNRDLMEFFPLPAKPVLPGACAAPSQRFPIGVSQIDVNGHLNNAEYAALLQDYVAANFPAFSVREMQMHYLHGILASDGLTLRGEYFAESGILTLAGYNDAGTLCVQALLQ